MAVILTINYSKKLGLPNFSSHQCSVSIQSEIADLSAVTNEVKRLYALAQDGVDREIQQVGWMPADPAYGLAEASNGNDRHGNGNGNNSSRTNGYGRPTDGLHANGNGRSTDARSSDSQYPNGSGSAWQCSPKQRDLIEKIVRENNLDKNEVDDLAKEMFDGVGVRQLNRLQASGLIDELLERHGGKRRNGNGRYQRQTNQHQMRGAE